MKIERKSAEPLQVFVPFMIQITFETLDDVGLFCLVLDDASSRTDEAAIKDLCNTLIERL